MTSMKLLHTSPGTPQHVRLLLLLTVNEWQNHYRATRIVGDEFRKCLKPICVN